MAFRLSTKLRNYLIDQGGWNQAMSGGAILVYTGTQPTTADDAATGTLLCTYTKSGGSRTAEVQATGTVTLTTGASGSVDTVTVNSIDILGGSVAYDTSLTVTATNVALQINRNPRNLLYTATSSGAVITLTAKHQIGSLMNGHAVSATLTTITATYVNIGSGVSGVSWINGISFDQAASGAIAKLATETWQGTAAATGTAGWFRIVGPIADNAAADTGILLSRADGSVATSGADLNMASTAFTISAVNTFSTFILTQPNT